MQTYVIMNAIVSSQAYGGRKGMEINEPSNSNFFTTFRP